MLQVCYIKFTKKQLLLSDCFYICIEGLLKQFGDGTEGLSNNFGGLVMSGTVNSINVAQRPMVNPSQFWAQSYASQAMIDGDDTFMGMAPVGGQAYMNSGDSIYGNGFPGAAGIGFTGAYPGAMGMGYGPGSEVMNMTQEQYMAYQESLENNQIDKQVRQQHKLASAGFRVSAAKDAVTSQIGVLQRKIHDNEQDYVVKEYNRLDTVAKEELAELGITNPTPAQLSAYKQKLYFEATGKSITDDLTEHGDSGFVHGLKKGMFGIGHLFANKTSYEANISAITGENESSTSKTWEKVGFGASALLTGGAVALGIFGLLKKVRI